MADRLLKLLVLERILKRYGVIANRTRGKGSNILFEQRRATGTFTYPVPNRRELQARYVRGCRKKFLLTTEDGVSDQEFYDG